MQEAISQAISPESQGGRSRVKQMAAKTKLSYLPSTMVRLIVENP
jgi:hypothetical protein